MGVLRMGRGLAHRRHQTQKRKAEVRRLLERWWGDLGKVTDERVGKESTMRKRCSCPGCSKANAYGDGRPDVLRPSERRVWWSDEEIEEELDEYRNNPYYPFTGPDTRDCASGRCPVCH